MSTTNQLDYAKPPRRSRRWIWILLLLLVLGLVGFMFVGVTSPVTITIGKTPPAAPPPATVPAVVLPTDPMTITLVQRRRVELPGAAGTPFLGIGDITRGQVLVSVTQANGPTLFYQSMKEGDSVKIATGGQTLHLKLAKLQNFLVGHDDQATFELSASSKLSESEKIDALYAYVKSLDGATFVRNGSNHTVDEAIDHLHRKQAAAGDKVKTAADFIDLLATGSSMTGEAYTIKLKDGTVHPSAELLKAKLKEIEAADAAK